jgi:carbonic anhydrase
LDLVPRKHGYYTYLGSQTAPPCNEGVTWFVLKTLNGRVVKESVAD